MITECLKLMQGNEEHHSAPGGGVDTARTMCVKFFSFGCEQKQQRRSICLPSLLAVCLPGRKEESGWQGTREAEGEHKSPVARDSLRCWSLGQEEKLLCGTD